MLTQTITHRFGLSTDESKGPQETRSGDPYAEICSKLHALLTRKRGYYGCELDQPLQNALSVQDQGISPWVYQLARIGEKVRRLSGLRRAIVPERSALIRETLMDIAGHAVVALAVMDVEEGK